VSTTAFRLRDRDADRGIVLDESQRAVLALSDAASAAVIGAPGSGKTTTLVEVLAERVLGRGWAPEEVLALSPTRTTATRLRDRLASRLALPTNGPLARTANSLAFEIATDAASALGLPAPRLLTGGEQDNDFRQLLAGHLEEGTGPEWPAELGDQVRALRGFRTELRDLRMRATEHGITTGAMRSLARQHSRPEWEAAAEFFDEYGEVAGWARPGHVDATELVRAAIGAVLAGELGDRVAGLRLILVDDFQESNESTVALLRAFASRGVAVIAFGDPDVASNVFRGGEPDSLGRMPAVLGVPDATILYLETVHRQGVPLRALTAAITARIGAAAAGRQRAAASADAAHVGRRTLEPGGEPGVGHRPDPVPVPGPGTGRPGDSADDTNAGTPAGPGVHALGQGGPARDALDRPAPGRGGDVLSGAVDPGAEGSGAVGAVAGEAASSTGPIRAAGPSRASSAASLLTSPIVRIESPTPARQYSSIARVLREQHLLGDVGWNEMAVVVRSGAQVPAVARALALADVPTRTVVGGAPLRDDHAASALLTVVDVGLGRAVLDPANARAMLLGPFGGLERLGLRRLRLALRAEELAGGGRRSGDDLIVEALGAPGRFASIEHRVGRSAERLAATLAEVDRLARSGATIEDLLWLVWDRSRLAPAWREQALGGGVTAAEAGRDLDGVLALFTAAKRFVERRPGAPVSVFLDGVLDAEVPEDTLSPQAAGDAVLVATPQGVIGLEFDVVAVVNVQEGVWPNLRLRGSLLHAQELVDAASGTGTVVVDARKQVLGDELRMFALAASRPRRQLIVSAVANDDEAPSVLLGLLPPDVPALDLSGASPLTLRGLTGRLRRELVSGNPGSDDRRAAAAALARLAAAGVPGADPDDWHGLADPSTTAPLFSLDERVPVSPSQLDRVQDSPLDWFLDRIAGSRTSTAMGLGTIVHWAMETATDQTVDGLFGEIESRWNELAFESPWMSEFQKTAARTLAGGIAEYLADFSRRGGRLVAAERRFELEIGRARLTGSIDRVERASDGAVAIIDLKTGNPVTKADEIREHPQLRAYQLAYAHGALDPYLEEHGPHHPGGAQLLFVKKGKDGRAYRTADQAPLDAEELEGFRERIEQAATLMAAATFSGVAEVTGWAALASGGAQLNRVRAVSSD
jgi:superfamily I DNA/RNA helicase/RecB family exonuclease